MENIRIVATLYSERNTFFVASKFKKKVKVDAIYKKKHVMRT